MERHPRERDLTGDDTEVFALDGPGQAPQKRQQDSLFFVRVYDDALVTRLFPSIPPAFARSVLLFLIPDGVEFVVPGDALGIALINESLDQAQDSGTVGAAIDQVAH